MGAFLIYVGYGGCDGGERYPPALVSSADVITTSKASSIVIVTTTSKASASVNVTTTSKASASVTPLFQGQRVKTGLNTQSKIGMGVGFALALLIVLALVGWECHRYRKRKREDSALRSESSPAFFAPKGELEAEERRKHELHHEERRYELEENGIREMAEERIDMTVLRKPELRGDDPLKELASSPL